MNSSSPLNILFVDDHSETRYVIGRLLKMLGHEVTTADCVASALREAEAATFNLLIADIGLPDGTGHALLKELTARGPIAGIVLSGYSAAEDVEQSKMRGFAAHLVKPVTSAQLEAAIERARSMATVSEADSIREARLTDV